MDGFTLDDLSNIFTLISAIESEEALIFLADIHYYFNMKRGSEGRLHIKKLLGENSVSLESFFFAVKCVVQGHNSSTVRCSSLHKVFFKLLSGPLCSSGSSV